MNGANQQANDACDNAKYKIASEYYVYNGAPIPKSAVNLVNIGGTDEDTSRSAFYWVLATRMNDYCGGTVNPYDVQVSFVAGNANGSSMITFMSSRGYQPVALSDIVSEAKANLEQSGNQTYDPPAEETSSQEDTPTYQYTETSQYVAQEASYGQSSLGEVIRSLFE